MKKIYLGVVLAVMVVVGIFVLNSSNTAEYVETVNDEVTQLENELAELDLAVEAGTLTSAQATEAKVKILNRLNTINESIAASESGKLTPAQQKQLSEGLDRLKNILITYQATLTVVDDTAVEADVKSKLESCGKTKCLNHVSKSLKLVVADTINIVQENIEDVVEDYESDEELDEQVDDVIEEETSDTEDEEMDDTEETMDNTEVDEATTTEDETSTDDSSILDIEVEGEVEVTQ